MAGRGLLRRFFRAAEFSRVRDDFRVGVAVDAFDEIPCNEGVDARWRAGRQVQTRGHF